MMFTIFQIAVLLFGVWFVAAEIKDMVHPRRKYPVYRAGERKFY